MELEIDIHKALVAKDAAKLEQYLKKLAKDKLELNKSEVAQLTLNQAKAEGGKREKREKPCVSIVVSKNH